MSVCLFLCLCVYVRVCVSVSVCLFLCLCMCVRVCGEHAVVQRGLHQTCTISLMIHSPKMVDGTQIHITAGRHPVIDQLLPEGRQFVPNGAHLSVLHTNKSLRA